MRTVALMLDWAVANGKISINHYRQRLGMTMLELGLTEDEVRAEAEGYAPGVIHRPRRDWFDHPPMYPVYRPGYRAPYCPPDIPDACYRADAGFMVHIRGKCGCKK